MAAPATSSPSDKKQSEYKSYPEKKFLGRIFKAIDHRCEQKQCDKITSGIIDHGLLPRSFRTTSYAAQIHRAVMIPTNIMRSSIHATIGTVTQIFKVQ